MRTNAHFRNLVGQRSAEASKQSKLVEDCNAKNGDDCKESGDDARKIPPEFRPELSDWSTLTLTRGQLSMQPQLLRSIIR